jgi:hypothetical protein
VVVRAGVVFAEPGMDEGVIGRLVIDLQEEELTWLEIGLEFEGGDLEWGCAWEERLGFGCNCSGEGVHLASTSICRVFIDRQCCHWYCMIKLGAWT